MNPIYNLALNLYAFGCRVAAMRSAKAGKMIRGQRESESAVRAALGDGGCDLWVHAASLGEFEQGRPFIERYRREHPQAKIMLTFFSPSGYEVRRGYDKVDVVAYLPFDTPRRVARFLDAARPKMTVMVKYEIWGNYLEELRRRGVPVYLISAVFRPGQPYFRKWGSTFRHMLRQFTHVYVQNEGSARLVESVMPDVSVMGDTRFDRVTQVKANAFSIECINRLTSADRLTLVAGSSWPQDEAAYLPWYKANRGKVNLLIAPHEFDESRLKKLLGEFAPGEAMLMSELEKASPDIADRVRVVIVDSFGKLSSLYRYGDIAYIGGGFGAGIHNINEAAVYGMPVVFGPNNKKFIEASEIVACGGGFALENPSDASAVLDSLLNDAALREKASARAGEYIASKIGATDKIYDHIFKIQNTSTPNIKK